MEGVLFMDKGKNIVTGVEAIQENGANTANKEDAVSKEDTVNRGDTVNKADSANSKDTVNKAGYFSAREALEKEITSLFDDVLFADGQGSQEERLALEKEFIKLFDMVLHSQDSQQEPVSLGTALGNLFDAVLFIEEKVHNLINMLEVLYLGTQCIRGVDEPQEASCISLVCDYVKFIYKTDLRGLHRMSEALLDVYGDREMD